MSSHLLFVRKYRPYVPRPSFHGNFRPHLWSKRLQFPLLLPSSLSIRRPVFPLFSLSKQREIAKKRRTNYFFLWLSIKYHRMCDHLERISQCYSVVCLEEVLLALEPAISQSYCEISFRRGIMMPKEKKLSHFWTSKKQCLVSFLFL